MFELRPECKERCPVFVAIRLLEDLLSPEDRLRLEEVAIDKLSGNECPTPKEPSMDTPYACAHPDNQDDQIGNQVMDLADVYIDPSLRPSRANELNTDFTDLFRAE